MKFTVEKDAIVDKIQIAQEIIASRANISILANVFITAEEDTITIRATDLKVNFEVVIKATVSEKGTTTIHFGTLLDFLRSVPSGDIEFSQEAENFIIRPKFKQIDFQLRAISPEKFPEILVRAPKQYFNIPQDAFSKMVQQTVFAVSNDEARYFMNGVFLETNENSFIMVATDGRRLSFIDHEKTNDISFNGVIIPPKALHIVRKLVGKEGMVDVSITDKHVFFKVNEYYISSGLIEGEFPNYQRVIPSDQKHKAVLNKAELGEALKRVAILVEKTNRIYLEFSQGKIQIRSEETEMGIAREDIPAQYNDETTIIALNYTYLIEPLRVMESESVSIEFSEPSKAITVQADPKSNYFHIIMPMQVS